MQDFPFPSPNWTGFFPTASFKKELEASRQRLLDNDQMAVKLELFSEQAKEGAVSALKAGNSTCNPYKIDVLSGSFRKLEVDWSHHYKN